MKMYCEVRRTDLHGLHHLVAVEGSGRSGERHQQLLQVSAGVSSQVLHQRLERNRGDGGGNESKPNISYKETISNTCVGRSFATTGTLILKIP